MCSHVGLLHIARWRLLECFDLDNLEIAAFLHLIKALAKGSFVKTPKESLAHDCAGHLGVRVLCGQRCTVVVERGPFERLWTDASSAS
jgi:hypothetical protein